MLTKQTSDLSQKYAHLIKFDILELSNPEHALLFRSIKESNPQLILVDQMESQLEELVKVSFPQEKFSKESAIIRALQWLKIDDLSNYGNWVHYPWLNTMVHLLPEEHFIKVRTSRNNYKITPKEQAVLATKKVGVIGLSVGQSISITMALERIFGEIRIADFDELELSNLNRIRAGVQNLGLPKVAMVAREIAEIDPYLKVKCYWEGITEENIDDYLTSGGNLDLVADECDEIYIKFMLRQRAKKHQIPVLMDTSDRGMLDVERFDLEPDRDIFHGMVNHLDPEGAKNLFTNEDKVTYALPIVGIDSASSRIKASMMEIGQTISTWPQLSSDVTLGGAISTNVIRRIFLDEHSDSGRFYADMSEIFKGNGSKDFDYHNFTPEEFPKLTQSDMEYDTENVSLIEGRIRPSESEEKEILEAAILAPSGANCQPWKWLVKNDAYFLFHDKHYSVSFNDFEDTASHLAMGCAAENFIRAAEHKGYKTYMNPLPFGGEHRLKAIFQLSKGNQDLNNDQQVTAAFPELNEFLLERKTNRNLSERQPIPETKYESLKEAARSIKGAELHLVTEDNQIDKLGKLVRIADKIRVLHPQCHYELFQKELRKTEEENLKYRDGIDMDLIDLSDTDRVAFEVAEDKRVIELLNSWNKGTGFTKISEKTIESSSALGMLKMSSNSALDYFYGGMSTQRLWLAATQLNLAFQPLTVLPYFFYRLHEGNGKGFNQRDLVTLKNSWDEFCEIIPSSKSEGLVFLFRLSIAKEPVKLALRRTYNDIVFYSA